MTRFQEAVDTVPFFGVGLLLLIGCVVLGDFALFIGWLLRLLEVQSIYDKLLPGWAAVHFFVASVVATIAAKLLAKGLPD